MSKAVVGFSCSADLQISVPSLTDSFKDFDFGGVREDAIHGWGKIVALTAAKDNTIFEKIGAGGVVGPHVKIGFSSQVGSSSIIGTETLIGSCVFVGKGALIGAHVVIVDGTSIGDHVVIGKGTQIGHNVVMGDNVTIGDGARIYPGSILEDGACVPAGVRVKTFLVTIPEGDDGEEDDTVVLIRSEDEAAVRWSSKGLFTDMSWKEVAETFPEFKDLVMVN